MGEGQEIQKETRTHQNRRTGLRVHQGNKDIFENMEKDIKGLQRRDWTLGKIFITLFTELQTDEKLWEHLTPEMTTTKGA